MKHRKATIALDLGCGLGLTSIILKLYLGNVEYLIGLDISYEKLLKVKNICLYDDLIAADAQTPPFRDKVFDLIISIEVMHDLPGSALGLIDLLSKGSVMLALPALPDKTSIRDLIKKGYHCYRYLLRGFVVISLNNSKIFLASDSNFLRLVHCLLRLLNPFLKVMGFLEKGYILAFK